MQPRSSIWNDIELELLLVEEEILEHDAKQRRYDEEVRLKQEQLNRDRDDLVFRQNVLRDMKRLGIKFYQV